MLDREALSLMVERRDAIVEWLEEQAPYTAVDQKHLDSHTAERAYWHYGYQAALTDILNLIGQENRAYGSAGKPN